uniref:Large ribosomal subunit protein uL29 n=1 Tax=Mustela putorius furo TaxID=9669 RepID=M3Z5D4_MUSPF
KKEEELLKQLEDPKLELSQLRTTKAAGGVASKLSKIELVCQSITCVLAIINQTQCTAGNSSRVRSLSQEDLWSKKTHAMCCWLNKHKENLKTKKQQQKEGLYSPLKYKVKA